jgi:hypothetical protein
VRIVTELIARKDATAIAIMTQEAKEVKNTRMVFSQGIDPFSDKRDQVPLATHISPYLIEMQQPTIILLAL